MKQKIITMMFLGMLLGSMALATTMMGQALPSTLLIQDKQSLELTTYEDNVTSGEMALIQSRNTPSEVYFEGDAPADFQFHDNLGAAIGGLTSIADERSFPNYFGLKNPAADNSLIQDPWSMVQWLQIGNNTEYNPTSGYNYNVSLAVDHLGTLAVSEQKDFDIAFNNFELQIDLSIPAEGVYLIFYESDTALNGLRIVSPNEFTVDSASLAGNLPDADGTGINGVPSIRDFVGFVANTPGTYRMYFRVATARSLNLELRSYVPRQTVMPGDKVVFQEEEYDNINPQTLQAATDGLPVHIYQIPVSMAQVINYNFDLIWGSAPLIFTAMPGPNGYTLTAAATNGADALDQSFEDGNAYLIIIHRNYFTWSDRVDFLYYKFSYKNVPHIQYSLGTSKMITLDGTNFFHEISFSVTDTSMAYFTEDFVSGTIGGGLTLGLGLKKNGEIFGVPSLLTQTTTGDLPRYLFELIPGDYLLYYTSAQSATTQKFELASVILPNTIQANALPHISISKQNQTIPQESTSSVEFGHYDIMGIASGTEGSDKKPMKFPFTATGISNNFRYNLTFLRSDNPDIGGKAFQVKVKTAYLQTSRNDGTSIVVLDATGDHTFTLATNANNETTMLGNPQVLVGDNSGQIIFWPYDVQIENSTGVWIPYNETIKFRIATLDQNAYYKEITGTLGNVDMHLAGINYTTQSFAIAGNYNSTEYDGVWCHISGSQQYDWWQFVMNLMGNDASEVATTSLDVVYDNVWDTVNGPTQSNFQTIYATGSMDNTQAAQEIGIVPQDFYVLLTADDNGSDLIYYQLNVAEFGVPVLKADVSSYIPEAETGGLSTGGIVAIVIVVVAAAGAGAFFFWKKKQSS